MIIFEQQVDSALIWESLSAIIGTVILIIGLEFLCWDHEWHEKLMKRKDIQKLYLSAIRQNLLAGFILGPPAYAIVTCFLALQNSYQPWFVSIPGVLFVQSGLYGIAHYWMHNSHKRIYATFHKYHHQFNETTFVRPITANAVTIAELLVPYQLPLVAGTLLCQPLRMTCFVP
mmetsp:Transcript_20184/g.30353  ORF Transcript_20184/g.30353 Transcript_20184/m.30353 type:complete len:173 (+) Transcript_20184:96-614(+)